MPRAGIAERRRKHPSARSDRSRPPPYLGGSVGSRDHRPRPGLRVATRGGAWRPARHRRWRCRVNARGAVGRFQLERLSHPGGRHHRRSAIAPLRLLRREEPHESLLTRRAPPLAVRASRVGAYRLDLSLPGVHRHPRRRVAATAIRGTSGKPRGRRKAKVVAPVHPPVVVVVVPAPDTREIRARVHGARHARRGRGRRGDHRRRERIVVVLEG